MPPGRDESRARVRCTTRGTVELETQLRLEAAHEAVARQSQALAHGAHAHGGERLQHVSGPARAGERQRREARGKIETARAKLAQLRAKREFVVNKITAEVQARIRLLAPGGGYILAPDTLIPVPPANYRAYLDAGERFGRYPIEAL